MFPRYAVAPRTLTRRIASVALLALPVLAPAAQAQRSEDEKILANYRLTMPTVRKVLAVQEKFLDAANSPDAKKWTKEMEGKSTGNMSIAELSAFYDRIPPIKQAVASTGLSTREYVTAMFSFFQAAMMVSMQEYAKQQGSKEAATLPPGISKENIELVRQNKAEIDQISKRLEALQKKQKDAQQANEEGGEAEPEDPR